jgi:hypothetical protein
VASAARKGNANVNTIKGTASRAARFNLFMYFTPGLVCLTSEL